MGYNYFMFDGSKILETRKSSFNGKIQVVKSLGFGTYIQVEGLTQSGGVVRDIWKTTLTKLKKDKISVSNCLILGLGGGSVAKLVKKNFSGAKITGVDIDPNMVELGKKYLGLGKIDMKIEIGDAYKYAKILKGKNKKFDLIIIDIYQGDKYPEKFESGKFLKLIYKLLTENGIAIFNRLYWDEKRKLAHKFLKKLNNVFGDVLPFYPEANVMFLCRK